jgi:4-hydroxy-L-threonine phosphate dehydrogenase PdxA
VHTKKPNVFICYEEEVTIEMGKPTTMSGKYAKLSLEAATMALFDKKIDVLVTAPINKHSMQEAGFNYPGHTEYLGDKLGGKPLMLLCSGDLRIAIVTGHVPIKNIAEKITTQNVLEKINQLHASLVKDFGIRKPKIAY